MMLLLLSASNTSGEGAACCTWGQRKLTQTNMGHCCIQRQPPWTSWTLWKQCAFHHIHNHPVAIFWRVTSKNSGRWESDMKSPVTGRLHPACRSSYMSTGNQLNRAVNVLMWFTCFSWELKQDSQLMGQYLSRNDCSERLFSFDWRCLKHVLSTCVWISEGNWGRCEVTLQDFYSIICIICHFFNVRVFLKII